MNKEKIRVRIAPSPTGYLHIGTARTALFNYLFAKKNDGKFVLRIEDTDLERSDLKYEKDIIEGMKWLGLEWDEGPIRQSDRLDIYEKYINQLLEVGDAYYCSCSKEELEKERQALLSQGFAPKYSGKCRDLKLTSGQVIRFKISEIKINFTDLIRGDISFDASLIGDIVIAKNARTPLYNFAVVVDDAEMKISHVIRGEDHIANAPKQILLQKALGFDQPHYAHLPLILDPDRSKMSKRHSATSVQEYKEAGYLPEALVNFMALLGWHPTDDKEIMSLKEIIEKFQLERVQKAGAVFNIEKLDWLNAQYIKNLSEKELAKLLDLKATTTNLKIVALNKDRMKKLSDFKELSVFLFKLPEYPSELLVWKGSSQKETLENLKLLEELIQKKKEKQIMALAEEKGKGNILWPLRVALSGQDKSPGPLEILDALGREEAVKRIDTAIKKLS